MLDTAGARVLLQRYLDAWVKDGAAAASQSYLVEDQQVTSGSPDTPQLTSGEIISIERSSASDGTLTVLVELDLTFAGDPVTWGNGRNTRFVTFNPRTGDVPYAISFSTGP